MDVKENRRLEVARMGTKLLSIAQTAEALGVSRDTIRRLIHRRELHSVRASRRVMVPQREIERVCEDGCGSQARIETDQAKEAFSMRASE